MAAHHPSHDDDFYETTQLMMKTILSFEIAQSSELAPQKCVLPTGMRLLDAVLLVVDADCWLDCVSSCGSAEFDDEMGRKKKKASQFARHTSFVHLAGNMIFGITRLNL
jgi:hypothetical protein